MKQYKLMFPSFTDYNAHNQKMSNHPLYMDNPGPIFNSIEDTLDYIDKDINVVQNFYDQYLPPKERTPAATKFLIENSKRRIRDREKQQALDDEIREMQMCLTPGQVVFHAGVDFLPENIIEPLSTSFSPTRAYMNAIHAGKAFDAKQLILYHLTVINPVPVYVYQKRSPDEHEVIFASAIRLGEVSIYDEKTIFFDNYSRDYDEVEFKIIKATIY